MSITMLEKMKLESVFNQNNFYDVLDTIGLICNEFCDNSMCIREQVEPEVWHDRGIALAEFIKEGKGYELECLAK